MTREESFELWGTFSVRDHVQPWAFVGEVLMYDRLVLPVPPADEPREWGRWRDERWNPDRQQRMLEVLGELAVPVEWTAERRARWGNEYAASRLALSGQLAAEIHLPYRMTGAVLLDDLPAMARGVVATAPFTSIPEAERALGILRLPSGTLLPEGVLSAVLATEFLVPDDPGRSELALLEDAVSVARSVDYRDARRSLYAFQRQFVRDGATYLHSMRAAVDEMARRAAALKVATDRERRWGGVRRALQVVQVAWPLTVAAVTMDPIAVGEAAVGVGVFTLTERLSNPTSPNDLLPAAALIVDAGRRLDDF